MEAGGITTISIVAICILGLFIIAYFTFNTELIMKGGNKNKLNNIYQQISTVSSFFK